FAEDAIGVMTRDPLDGTLTDLQQVRNGINVSNLDGPAAITVSPAPGKLVFVASENSSSIASFVRDSNSVSPTYGQLDPVAVYKDGVPVPGLPTPDGLSGATAVAVSPDGNNLYVAGQFEASIAVFHITTVAGPDFGTLVYRGKVTNSVGGVTGL